ncbi:uncharacterized protein LOC125647215 [Ostrea edulis]|uniref:uncharacterized protein LOC125647215 n=1 Tax=Ostrea edulis TaxID=37623 RepID=UPI0024AFAFE6|nr:uncharacterized protein LOC125647215 [Ostrea edulis]
MAAVYPHRICNQQVLPTIIQSNGTRNCNCSLPCLFRDPCSCCMDTALLYPVDCISNTRRAFSKDGKERELKIQVVGICYEEIHRSRNSRERENVKHLCEGELDEFDIPVLSNNITYKNIFCFLCNTNFFIVNGSLLTEPYKIVDIKINCEEQFLFNFMMGFHQMFAYSILNKCDVRYEADFLVTCHDNASEALGTISKCKASDSHFDPFEKWACENTSRQSLMPVGNYKNEFCRLCNPSEITKLPTYLKECKESDTRNLKSKSTEDGCFPGRIMEDGICTPIIVYPRMIPYDLHVLCSLKISASTNDTKRILSKIKSSVFEILKNSTFNSDGEIIGFYILPRQPVRTQNRNGFIYSELQVSLHYVLLHTTPFNRMEEENKLLKIPQMLKMNHTTDAPNKISFLINGIRFANLSKTLTSPNIMILINEHASFLKYYKQMLLHLYNPLACNVIVSELLTCRHRFIDKMNYVVDKKHYRIIIKSSNEVFYLGEYIIHFDQKVSVCANVPLKISLETGLSEALGILTTVLNGISILFLFVLFAIYIYIPNLRTLPGMNMLNLTFCLFCMQITYTIANALQKATFYCKVTGILLHYFWLCLCCSMFICSLHMFRSFRNFSSIRHGHGNHSNKIFLRYAIICYTVPFIMVLLNVVLSYYINGSVGYGVRLCFVDHYIQNIVTFIVPLLLTCINNIVMFICTIPNINFSRDIKKSEDNRSELLIFIKLFSLTGGVWILQVIDSILHISFFSFVTTILTSSQGLFIFLSFAMSQQILKHLKEIRRGFGRNVGVQRK